jgi:BNR repeat-like domain
MRRLALVLALVLVAPAAAATIRTVHGTRGDDFIQASFDGIDKVDCRGGFDVVAADLGDTVSASCEVVSRRLSVDPSTNAGGQHETSVEPDDFASGSTVVATYQVGRFATGGASNIGFAVSRDAGRTWQRGILPGLTVESNPPGPERAASDPAVTFDAVHGAWLITTLTLEQGGTRVQVSRSTDGAHWSSPVTVAAGPALDKEWIACDDGATSSLRGRCYDMYTDDAKNQVSSQSSDDGGLTWSAPVRVGGNLVGMQPVVLGDGTVVTVAGSFDERGTTGTIEGARSTDGGVTFTPFTVAPLQAAAGTPVRAISLPTLALDGSGRIYVAWTDCRFRPGCTANDVVFSSSTDGLTWSQPARIPVSVGATSSALVVGLGADPARGSRLALVYASFTSSCACRLGVASVQSRDGGATWTKPLRLDAVPMQMPWLPEASGRMVGDYFSAAFAGDRVVPVFALAVAPTGTRLHEAIFATSLKALP